jgi:prepilin peptidase CpaA
MIPNSSLATVISVLAAAVLFYTAWSDLRHFKIRNDVIVVLLLLYVAHTLVSGRWTSLPWNLGFAAIMLAALIYCYSQKLVGGGDVKLLTVALLWTGLDCALPFAVLLAVFAMIHTLAAKLGWAGTQHLKDDARKRIPFAPSIAAALIAVFALGCLQPH